jgi:MFS superfamily sulfate permease-like transporter
MVRIAAMLWAIGGTVFAGIAIMTVLAVPSFADHAMSYIPYAALAGFIVAIPVAVIVARQIGKSGKTATR